MSARNRIIALLQTNPDGLDDDRVAEMLALPQRQRANAVCRELTREGLVERRLVGGKIRNFLTNGPVAPPTLHAPAVLQISATGSGKPWCWEGNVVRALTSYLADSGWVIEKVAATETGESGADIRARRRDCILIVEVKGYPSKVYERGPKQGQPKRTNPATQARHWVGEALLTALLRQSASHEHQVAIAFPEFGVYTKLLARIDKSLRTLGLIVLVVRESGAVVVVEDGNHILERGTPA